MNKRPTKENLSEQRSAKPPATEYFGVEKSVPAPVGVPRLGMTDPHLMLLSNAAFDVFTEALDEPPAPSEGAKQAVARARIWRR